MTVPALILAAAASLTLAVSPVLPDFGLSSAPPDLSALEAAQQLPADALPASDWADRRDHLHALWEQHEASLPADERFELAVQIGRTAALAAEPIPPFFVDGTNAFYDMARRLDEEAGGRLVATVSDPELAAALGGRRAHDAERDVTAYMQRVDETSGIPWNALSEADWSERRDELADGFVAHRDGLTPKQLLLALAQVGRAAENSNTASDRFYPRVPERDTHVNVAWLAAAGVEMSHPGLLDGLTDGDTKMSIAHLLSRIQDGSMKPVRYAEVF